MLPLRRESQQMPAFVIRVELKGDPPKETYAKLHALMAEQGFSQTISGNHNVTGKFTELPLPHATYYGELATSETETVKDSLATHITQKIQRDIVMVVLRIDQWSIYTNSRVGALLQAARR
jgi:hypothetical protein